MKFFFSIIAYLFCLLPFKVSAQVDIVNLSLNDTTKKELYIGIFNEVVIRNVEVDSGKYTLRINDSFEVEVENNKLSYQCMIYQNYRFHKLVLYKDGEMLYEKEFQWKRIEDPVVIIGDDLKENYTVEDLQKAKEIRTYVPENNLKLYEPEIIGYTMQLYKKNELWKTVYSNFNCNIDTVYSIDSVSGEETVVYKKRDAIDTCEFFIGNIIPENYLNYLQQLSIGDKVIITEITIKLMKNVIRKLNQDIILEKTQ